MQMNISVYIHFMTNTHVFLINEYELYPNLHYSVGYSMSLECLHLSNLQKWVKGNNSAGAPALFRGLHPTYM